MSIPATRAAVYSVAFGLAIAVNVFLWFEVADHWRWVWSIVSFGLCTGVMQMSFSMAARDVMSEHKIGNLGAEE